MQRTTTAALRCADCTATAEPGQALTHVWSCPIAVADRDQLRDDLAWLRRHPDEMRTRPATWAEREHLHLTGLSPEVTRRAAVLVSRAGPGARALLHVVDGAVIAVSTDLGELS